MTRILPLVAIILIALACGSTPVDTTDVTGTTAPPTSSTDPTTPSTDPTTSEPEDEQLALLRAARATWDASAPASYAFEYFLGCECDGGPFRVEVDENGKSTITHLYGGSTEWAYPSIDAILDEIEQAILAGEVPVRAEYDAEYGYPSFYVWNEPELPVDGGFTLEITDFVADPGGELEELEAARAGWKGLGIVDYDYTFERSCFCPDEWRGPYEVQVRNGEIVSATFQGTDLFEIDVVDIGSYGEIILTVDDLYDEIERSIGQVAELRVEYHSDLSYPTNVYIDGDRRVADDELGLTIERLRPVPAPLDECSTSAVTLDLLPQPDLPEAVETKRQAIYDAAMACDVAGLAALTDPAGFNASFGGGDPATLWTEAEARGEPVLLDLVLHLNQAYTVFGDGGDITGYVWPSAFLELEAPDGTGLPPEEYAALLELYSRDEIEEMFEFVGGYVGYRIGILPNGEWTYFVAGD